MYSYDEIIK